MRMRKKQNLIPRMERCAHLMIDEPAILRGQWLSKFPERRLLWLELGCGKGKFTAETAAQNPEALLLAIDKVPEAMVVGMERVCDEKIANVRFVDTDILALPLIVGEKEADRIYINFCDPWPKNRHAKHRLTSPGFLQIYARLLKPGGEIHFKTDNGPLFEYSAEALLQEGWEILSLTRDLHADGVCGVMTDYEARFHEQGIKINRLTARKDRGA